MRTWMRMIAAATALLSAASGRAVESLSTWSPDELRRYDYEVTVNAAGAAWVLRSTFAERARALRADGAVELDITVETLEVCTGRPARCQRPPLDGAVSRLRAVGERNGRVTASGGPTVRLRDGRIQVDGGAATTSVGDVALEIVPLKLLASIAIPQPAAARATGAETRRATAAAPATPRPESTRAHVTLRDAQRRVSGDVAASFAIPGGALLEARGVLIDWQPLKRNSVVLLRRRR